jgi:hypothetical protein
MRKGYNRAPQPGYPEVPTWQHKSKIPTTGVQLMAEAKNIKVRPPELVQASAAAGLWI